MFLLKTKDYEVFMELQKCGHPGKSNYGLNLSIILVFLTIYGVEKSQCDRSKRLLHFVPNFNSPEVKDFLLTMNGHTKFISKVHSDNFPTSPKFLSTGINRIMTSTENVMPKYFSPSN